MDKPKNPKMNQNLDNRRPLPAHSRGSVDRSIRAFLAGETHGEEVLGALYGHVADEPVPERLRQLLKH